MKNEENNILMVANWESNVGYAWWLMENFWITINKHFSGSNTACYLIYPRITKLPETIESSTIKTHELDMSDHSIMNIIALIRFIRKNNISHIYLSDYPSYSFFYLILRFFGIKNIVVHDHTPGERTTATGLNRAFKRFIQSIPLITADLNIAVTEYVKQRHLSVNCIPAQKCSIASNGIWPIDTSNIDKMYAYEQFNIPYERRIIVTTGRASYYKGIDFFIDCANELINTQGHTNIHFLFCGDGPDMDDFVSLREQYSLNDYLTFAGKRNDVIKILPSCEIGFHCATGEVGYSLSILEYMSAGLVTIVPDNPSTSLATEHKVNGILYKPKDLHSATHAILQALETADIDNLKRNAIKSINEKFSIVNTNKQLVKILESIYS